jgi:signal transduction histidine kinase
MITEALFVYSIILVLLLLIICMVLFYLFRKSSINEKKLSQQIHSIIESDNKRNEFFSNITHELKTPLSIILGAVQVMEIYMGGLANKELVEADNKLARNIKVVKCNCFRLLRLIYNMLDVARAEAGYQLLKPKNCDLDILLEEIVNSVKPYAEEKQLNLMYKPSSERIIIAVDVEKIERIMLNLLSNAIKFTKPGGFVQVTSYKSGNRACISVRDSGIGIPEEKQESIFNRYSQIGHSPRAENEGSGIGLSLVKSFVDLHEGNIKIESEYKKGANFIIDLPIKLINSDTDEFMANGLNSGITEAAKLEFSIFPNFSA